MRLKLILACSVLLVSNVQAFDAKFVWDKYSWPTFIHDGTFTMEKSDDNMKTWHAVVTIPGTASNWVDQGITLFNFLPCYRLIAQSGSTTPSLPTAPVCLQSIDTPTHFKFDSIKGKDGKHD